MAKWDVIINIHTGWVKKKCDLKPAWKAYWALLDLIWPYWALLGITRSYWALLGLTGLPFEFVHTLTNWLTNFWDHTFFNSPCRHKLQFSYNPAFCCPASITIYWGSRSKYIWYYSSFTSKSPPWENLQWLFCWQIFRITQSSPKLVWCIWFIIWLLWTENHIM